MLTPVELSEHYQSHRKYYIAAQTTTKEKPLVFLGQTDRDPYNSNSEKVLHFYLTVSSAFGFNTLSEAASFGISKESIKFFKKPNHPIDLNSITIIQTELQPVWSMGDINFASLLEMG